MVMNRDNVLEKVCKAVGASEREKKLLEEALDIIPKEALEVLKNREEFFKAVKYAIEEIRVWHSLAKDDELIGYFARYFVEDFFARVPALINDINIFGLSGFHNSKRLLSVAPLFYVGYLKLYGYKSVSHDKQEALAYVVRNYQSLENLKERLKEYKEVKKLQSFYKETPFHTLRPFLFFIKRAYNVRIETFDGGKVEDNLINIKNAKEINKAIAKNPLDFFKKQGEEILNALERKFPSIKKICENSAHKYSELLLIVGTYSKEEFLTAFQENYIDLIKRLAPGLEQETLIIRAVINRILYNQKDLFVSGLIFLTRPSFPYKIHCFNFNKPLIINNGYEMLALDILKSLPFRTREVYFERYKDNPQKLLDLYWASLYYKYAKNLEGYDKEALNSFLDKMEKHFRKKEETQVKTIINVWA